MLDAVYLAVGFGFLALTAPETTMSYLTQMAGLTVHNFVSAATGIVLAVALIRGFARRTAQGVGNFCVDLTRCVLYILLPISIAVGLFFVWQSMLQNLNAYAEATTLEGVKPDLRPNWFETLGALTRVHAARFSPPSIVF